MTPGSGIIRHVNCAFHFKSKKKKKKTQTGRLYYFKLSSQNGLGWCVLRNWFIGCSRRSFEMELWDQTMLHNVESAC